MTTISQTASATPTLSRLLADLQAQSTQSKATTAAAAPDRHNADRAADALATTAARPQPRSGALSRLAPTLSAPVAPEPKSAALQTLHAALDAEGAQPVQVAVFMQAVIRAVGEQEMTALRGAELPASEAGEQVASTVLPLLLQEQFKSLIGLQSNDGELVFPTVKAREALSGLMTPTTDGQEPLGALLSDTPAIASLLNEASAMNDEELSVRMNSDPRFAFVLMLIAFLMKLAASQREQAAGMLIFAEKSVHDMGERMVDSAKQQQLAKIVALVVVVVVSTVAVGVGATAANRNINSIKTNQRTANDLNAQANKSEVKLAAGVNDAPAGSTPMSFGQRTALRTSITRNHEQAAVASAQHLKTQTSMSVVNQTGQTLGQAGNAAGSAAGSGHEIQAADLSAQQEKRRADATAGQQINQAISQNTSKVDESTQALFRQAQQAEQEKADARNAITNNISG